MLCAWTLLLLVGLLWPGDSLPGLDTGCLPDLPEGSDKLVHAVLFAVETLLLRRWLGGAGRTHPLLGAVLLAAVLAASTEVLQTWVPRRRADPADLAANVLGIAVSAAWAARAATGFSST